MVVDIHSNGTDDGWHGVISSSPDSQFPPDASRYHLYIGLFCPFAHRANLVRHMCGLTSAIPISVVKPYPKGNDKGWPGWRFPATDDEYPDATVDHLFASRFIHEVYFKDDAEYKGRYSVPLLWDVKQGKAVNNESAEMLRWLPSVAPALGGKALDLYPKHLRAEIDRMGQWINDDINVGMYKAGFAKDQQSYEENVVKAFGALNRLEQILWENKGPFVLGKEMTELDIRLYATIVRFDTVYVQHFKCNLGTIRHDYPVLNNWLKYLYWSVPGFKETTCFKHIKENYTKSHDDINPKHITPIGPIPDVESGYEEDWSKLKTGRVIYPGVNEHETKL